jgi:integrase
VKHLNQWHDANLTEVEVPKREPRKYIPHAHTDEELLRFFTECDQPYAAMNPATDANRQNLIIPVIFRLLYSTGMRPFEVRMLKRTDVCFDSGVVGIEVSKGYDQRYIVLHDTMLTLMLQYDKAISRICPDRSYFFPGEDNGFIDPKRLNAVFRKLWNRISSTKCRLYDFRHNYAIQNINAWLSAGMSYHSKLVYLSKSMGHRDIEGTCYYYALTPVMAEIQERQSRQPFDDLIPEVRYEKNL